MSAESQQARTGVADHPLDGILEKICTYAGGFIKAQVGRPDGPYWFHAADIPAHRQTIRDGLARMGDDLDTEDRRVISSFFFKTYCNHAIGVPIIGLLGLGCLPDVRAENIWFRLGDSGGIEEIAFERGSFATTPDGPGAAHPDAVIVANGVALRELFLTWVVDEHLDLVIDELRPELALGTRALWGTAADSNAGITIIAATRLGMADRCAVEVPALLARPQFPPRAGVTFIEVDGRQEPVMTRSVCCHAYRLPIYPQKCATCPHLSPEERERRIRAGEH